MAQRRCLTVAWLCSLQQRQRCCRGSGVLPELGAGWESTILLSLLEDPWVYFKAGAVLCLLAARMPVGLTGSTPIHTQDPSLAIVCNHLAVSATSACPHIDCMRFGAANKTPLLLSCLCSPQSLGPQTDSLSTSRCQSSPRHPNAKPPRTLAATAPARGLLEALSAFRLQRISCLGVDVINALITSLVSRQRRLQRLATMLLLLPPPRAPQMQQARCLGCLCSDSSSSEAHRLGGSTATG